MKKIFLLLVLFVSFKGFSVEESVPANPSVAEDLKIEIPIPSLKEPSSEVQIPVVLETKKASHSSDSPWLRVILACAVFAIMGAGMWLFSKKVKSKNFKLDSAPEIKVLRQHYLGPKKSLAIIRVAGESILIGVTENNINLIKELSLLDEDIPNEVPNSFSGTIRAAGAESEDFSMMGIKDAVTNKLKNMRAI